MSVTVNVNGLSLCHKGSGGVSMATVPDVCKTPSPGGPVPVPYPNVAKASDLAKGTTTVAADGGNTCAKYGSEFSLSAGDEPGTAGGVKSSTFKKEASWITHSFDVKLEGKGACRLTDKMFHNHQNTVNMGGLLQQILELGEVRVLCKLMCDCIREGNPKQRCVEDKLTAADVATGGNNPMKPEVPYAMRESPPAPIPKDWKFPDYLKMRFYRDPKNPRPEPLLQCWKDYGSGTRKGDVKIPDITILADPSAAPRGDNIRGLVEMKMPGDPNPFGSESAEAQVADYERIATQDGTNPDGSVMSLDEKSCGCSAKRTEPVLSPALEKQNERLKQLRAAPQAVPAAPGGSWLPSPSGAMAKAVSGVGLMLGGAALTAASAAAAVVLVADDVSVVGVIDDAALPLAAGGMAVGVGAMSTGSALLRSAFGF